MSDGPRLDREARKHQDALPAVCADAPFTTARRHEESRDAKNENAFHEGLRAVIESWPSKDVDVDRQTRPTPSLTADRYESGISEAAPDAGEPSGIAGGDDLDVIFSAVGEAEALLVPEGITVPADDELSRRTMPSWIPHSDADVTGDCNDEGNGEVREVRATPLVEQHVQGTKTNADDAVAGLQASNRTTRGGPLLTASKRMDAPADGGASNPAGTSINTLTIADPGGTATAASSFMETEGHMATGKGRGDEVRAVNEWIPDRDVPIPADKKDSDPAATMLEEPSPGMRLRWHDEPTIPVNRVGDVDRADMTAPSEYRPPPTLSIDGPSDDGGVTDGTVNSLGNTAAGADPEVGDRALGLNMGIPTADSAVHGTAAAGPSLSPPRAADVPLDTSGGTGMETIRFSIADGDLMDHPDGFEQSAGESRGSALLSASMTREPAEDAVLEIDRSETEPVGRGAVAGSVAPDGPTPMERANTIAEVTDHLDRWVLRSATMQGDGLRVELLPAALGRLVLQCRESEGGLTVEIGVTNPAVRSLLVNQEQGLRESLESQGLSLGRFSVSCDGRDGQSPGQEGRQFGEFQDRREIGPDRRSTVTDTTQEPFRRQPKDRNRWVA